MAKIHVLVKQQDEANWLKHTGYGAYGVFSVTEDYQDMIGFRFNRRRNFNTSRS